LDHDAGDLLYGGFSDNNVMCNAQLTENHGTFTAKYVEHFIDSDRHDVLKLRLKMEEQREGIKKFTRIATIARHMTWAWQSIASETWIDR
jgi:hypothetical protein